MAGRGVPRELTRPHQRLRVGLDVLEECDGQWRWLLMDLEVKRKKEA